MTEQEEFEFRLRHEREQAAGDAAKQFSDARRQRTADQVGGLVRGAGSIGATILAPIDAAARAVGVQNDYIGRTDRREAMDAALRELIGANPEAGWFKANKIAAEVAGTAGVGGLLAGGARAAGAAPAVVDALASGGFSTGQQAVGAGARAADLALRTAAGGAVGGASAGLIDPGSAKTGAVVGAVLPGALQGLAAAGSVVGGALKPARVRAAERVARALDADPAQVAGRLQGAVELVPGSQPTAAQVLRTPQASMLERIVSESPGGSALKERYAAQNAARMDALERVAPVDPRGLRSAQQDFGTDALATIRSGDAAARAQTRAAYRAVPQDEAALYPPDLATIRDQFFPPGAFGGRQAVDDAVRSAQQIGTLELPGIVPTRMPAQAGPNLAQAVRGRGGISITNNDGLRGEVASLRGDVKNLVRVNGGMPPDRMAQAMHEAGLLEEPTADALFEALRAEARGTRTVYQPGGSDQLWRAEAERAMGDAPGAQTVPQKATLAQIDALRKSIGNAARGAARDPERATEAAALNEMKAAIDARINEVARGDGAIDEVLPIEWANALSEAQGLKRAQVDKYRTGPQASAFRMGADNMPAVRGGEFAGQVWGNRAGIADDLKQFRKILDDKPALLKQFRSMVATEAAGTATAGGNLSARFVRWVDNSLPGLKASFEPEQVRALQRIAADIRRAHVASAAGAAQGSNTYQNIGNAMSLGLLDSQALNAAANNIPVVRSFSGPALQWMRESARERMAREMAALLADPTVAASAIGQLGQAARPSAIQQLFPAAGRLAPAIVADR